MFCCKLSNTVNTEMMQKIPMVTPSNERKVRNLLLRNSLITIDIDSEKKYMLACKANRD
jgi:hypothetical protein